MNGAINLAAFVNRFRDVRLSEYVSATAEKWCGRYGGGGGSGGGIEVGVGVRALLLGYTVHAWTLIFYLLFSQSVEVKDMAVPAMFITAQRQLWSENLRVAEGNPFTSLPLGFTVGCLIQGIDFNHSCLAPKLPIDLPFWQLLVGNLITATYIVI